MRKNILFLIVLVILVLISAYYSLNYSQEENLGWIEGNLLNSEVVKVSECNYNSEEVYYFESPECCDFINHLYNSKGEIICSFGGIAGTNTCPDFDISSCIKNIWNIPNNDNLTNCKVWKDDCNTCTKQGCTEIACSERTGIKCIEYNSESNAEYKNLEEYALSIDYSCNKDSDCVIKDIHNCCGYYPACANKNARTDPDFVSKFCSEEGLYSVCGWASIKSCGCLNNKCQGVF
ncbi:hypothetical protein FJZ21_00550 [Candidatus Pacearchaeota archaeon]|nr:hypothetical protein [Candidatus Pacearchaeota archaeon]